MCCKNWKHISDDIVFKQETSTWVSWNKASTHQAMEEDWPVSVAKKRKGGHKQRLQALEREVGSGPASVEKPSLLAGWLKKQWAWGQLSPQTLQHIASLATRDMQAAGAFEIPQDLIDLSMLGSRGTHSNNCHRDLMSLVAGASHLPKPLQVAIPMKVPGGHACLAKHNVAT